MDAQGSDNYEEYLHTLAVHATMTSVIWMPHFTSRAPGALISLVWSCLVIPIRWYEGCEPMAVGLAMAAARAGGVKKESQTSIRQLAWRTTAALLAIMTCAWGVCFFLWCPSCCFLVNLVLLHYYMYVYSLL